MNKKGSIICILEILSKKTNEDHRLNFDAIVDILAQEYGMELDKKAVGRNINILIDMGYDITKTRNGTYMQSRDFDNTELKFLLDSVLTNRFITPQNTDQIIKKLYDLTDPKLKEISSYVEKFKTFSKSKNNNVFYNIELIEEAIQKGLQISFKYYVYDENYKLVEKHPGKIYTASPYRLIVKNQRYYMMSKDHEKQKLVYFKLDKMQNITITNKAAESINTLNSFYHGINDKVLFDALPYLFSDKPTEIILELIDNSAIDIIGDWFGDNAKFTDCINGRKRVKIKASANAMKYWALQYMDIVKVISPEPLKQEIIKSLKKSASEYSK